MSFKFRNFQRYNANLPLRPSIPEKYKIKPQVLYILEFAQFVIGVILIIIAFTLLFDVNNGVNYSSVLLLILSLLFLFSAISMGMNSKNFRIISFSTFLLSYLALTIFDNIIINISGLFLMFYLYCILYRTISVQKYYEWCVSISSQ